MCLSHGDAKKDGPGEIRLGPRPGRHQIPDMVTVFEELLSPQNGLCCRNKGHR
ncbi:hypothetical protein ACRALDRAFT_2036814, partial [Sodiomyces alcalophilus JCM 7366]|uniref:uncharacterized protein n=1 Tax=Sodiomyces alcalophilus JCM 7366 TaxID=591952 RepID=UPI0039B5805E